MRISDWSSDVCSSDLFKIAFDEALGRFSPGVLIEIANLQAVLGDPAIGWMDSCAAADHPMIDSLWGERRTITQYRSEERRVGKECVSTCRSRWSPYH